MRIQEVWASGRRKSRPNHAQSYIWSIDVLILCPSRVQVENVEAWRGLSMAVAGAPSKSPPNAVPPASARGFWWSRRGQGPWSLMQSLGLEWSWYLDQRNHLFFCVWIKVCMVCETPTDSSSEVLWDLCHARRQTRKRAQVKDLIQAAGVRPCWMWALNNIKRRKAWWPSFLAEHVIPVVTVYLCYVLCVIYVYYTIVYIYTQHEYIH